MLKESCTLVGASRGKREKGDRGTQDHPRLGVKQTKKEKKTRQVMVIRIVRDTAAAGYLWRSMAKGISFCLASQLKKKTCNTREGE